MDAACRPAAAKDQTRLETLMTAKFPLAAACAAALSLLATAAMAGAGDYVFEPVKSEMKKGDDVVVAIRLTNKTTGKPVTDAVIFKTRVDMAPDNMADMESPVTPLPAPEPGVYAFKTDLPMAGHYQVTLSAKVQGEPETVTGKVIVKAFK
jgi:hypothetical protein